MGIKRWLSLRCREGGQTQHIILGSHRNIDISSPPRPLFQRQHSTCAPTPSSSSRLLPCPSLPSPPVSARTPCPRPPRLSAVTPLSRWRPARAMTARWPASTEARVPARPRLREARRMPSSSSERVPPSRTPSSERTRWRVSTAWAVAAPLRMCGSRMSARTPSPSRRMRPALRLASSAVELTRPPTRLSSTTAAVASAFPTSTPRITARFTELAARAMRASALSPSRASPPTAAARLPALTRTPATRLLLSTFAPMLRPSASSTRAPVPSRASAKFFVNWNWKSRQLF